MQEPPFQVVLDLKESILENLRDIAGTTMASSPYEVDYNDVDSFVPGSAGKDEEKITCGR